MCRVTMGHLRVTIGHLRVTVGHPRVTIGHLRVTIGHLRVTMGHLRLTIGYLKATVVHISVTLGHLRVTIGYFFLYANIRQTQLSFTKFHTWGHSITFLFSHAVKDHCNSKLCRKLVNFQCLMKRSFN